MADSELEDDSIDVDITPRALDLRTTGLDRFLSVVKSFLIHAVWIWLATGLILQLSMPQMRFKRRTRVAIAIALPAAALLALRRFATQYHRISCNEELILLRNTLGEVNLDPLDVDGLIGTGGANLNASETDVWKEVVLLAGGKHYSITLEKVTNEYCYQYLRGICIHAWGIPFAGKLEPPLAGPELDPDEYVDALRHVRRYYRRYTQRSIFNGVLMMAGSGVAALALATNLPIGNRVSRLYFWLLVVAFIGLLMTIRAVRQIPVVLTVRSTERRLRQAL